MKVTKVFICTDLSCTASIQCRHTYYLYTDVIQIQWIRRFCGQLLLLCNAKSAPASDKCTVFQFRVNGLGGSLHKTVAYWRSYRLDLWGPLLHHLFS